MSSPPKHLLTSSNRSPAAWGGLNCSLRAPRCSLLPGNRRSARLPWARGARHGAGGSEAEQPQNKQVKRQELLPSPTGVKSEPGGRSPGRLPPRWGCCVLGATTAAAHFFSRKGLKSPQSNASMAWGLGRSLGFLKLSFSVRRVLSTSTGSVLPVNFCTGSSLQGDQLCCDRGGQDGDPSPC